MPLPLMTRQQQLPARSLGRRIVWEDKMDRRSLEKPFCCNGITVHRLGAFVDQSRMRTAHVEVVNIKLPKACYIWNQNMFQSRQHISRRPIQLWDLPKSRLQLTSYPPVTWPERMFHRTVNRSRHNAAGRFVSFQCHKQTLEDAIDVLHVAE